MCCNANKLESSEYVFFIYILVLLYQLHQYSHSLMFHFTYNTDILTTIMVICMFYSCNMGMDDLPEMYAQSLRAQPEDVGIHFRQITYKSEGVA